MRKLLLILLLVPMMSFGQNVYIPDANFKACLVSNSSINTNGDTEIQVSEASTFYGAIECQLMNISDLTGIEAFTALSTLFIQGNQLTSIDVSQNAALTALQCINNPLTSLDVSQNTALQILWCFQNQFTSLDVSQNTALTTLRCGNPLLTGLDVSQNPALTELNFYNSQLTSLDVSQNAALTTLQCSGNSLTSLDVSQNPALTELFCENNQLTCLNAANGQNTSLTMTLPGNPNLTCIEVDDETWATDNTQIDPQMYFSEDCNNDCSSSTVGINELTTSKNLIQIVDMLGRKTPFKPNTPLLYIYDDGTVERKMIIE